MSLEERIKTLEDLVQRLTQALLAAPTRPVQTTNIEQGLPVSLPLEITHFVDATREQGFFKLAPKHFLQQKDFTLVNDYVKTLHGEYVKATNNQHGFWKIPEAKQ